MWLYHVNENDEVIGKVNEEEAHKRHLLHKSVHILLTNSKGEIFCRQRSLKKKRYPGYWSTSVGAHVMYGETYEDAIYRALKETLGIDCKLKMIGKDRIEDDVENEISALFVGHYDGKLKFNFQQIEGGKFFSVEELGKLIKKEKVTPHLVQALRRYLSYLNSNPIFLKF